MPGHYANTEIQSLCDSVIENREDLKGRAAERRSMLEQSHEKQCFNRDINEAEAWIGEQMLIASDDTYRNPTNLQVCVFTYNSVHVSHIILFCRAKFKSSMPLKLRLLPIVLK